MNWVDLIDGAHEWMPRKCKRHAILVFAVAALLLSNPVQRSLIW